MQIWSGAERVESSLGGLKGAGRAEEGGQSSGWSGGGNTAGPRGDKSGRPAN